MDERVHARVRVVEVAAFRKRARRGCREELEERRAEIRELGCRKREVRERRQVRERGRGGEASIEEDIVPVFVGRPSPSASVVVAVKSEAIRGRCVVFVWSRRSAKIVARLLGEPVVA